MGSFVAVDHLHCTGCKTCEMICSLYHFGQCNPLKSAIRVIRREKDGLVFCLPLLCQQCEPAPCIEVCPTDALYRDRDQGNMILNKDECNACGLCTEICPLGCISIDTGEGNLISCNLCDGDPQCIPACHANCLTEVDRSKRNGKQEVEYLARILEEENLIGNIPGRRSSS